MAEISEKVENSLVSYLTNFVNGDVDSLPPNTDVPSSFYWPASLQKGDKSYRIFAGESAADKDGQAILCIADDSPAEYPQYCGNFYVPCEIWLRTPIRVLTTTERTNGVTEPLDNHKAAAAMLSMAIMGDPFGLKDSLTEQVDEFTCMAVLDRQPMRQQVENYWASGFSLRLYCVGRDLTVAN